MFGRVHFAVRRIIAKALTQTALKRGLEFFVVGDQLLRGAALNAVVIAEVVLKR